MPKASENTLEQIQLYSYIVSSDRGFSPNPFWGVCTLACCKPTIRRSIGKQMKSKDTEYWVVGLSPKSQGNQIVYVMKVNESMTFDEYYNHPKYNVKKPDMSKSERIYKNGDNIYQLIGNGVYKQLESRHNEEDIERDLSGQYVLVSDNFWYFGSNTIPLPLEFHDFIVGRGQKTTLDSSLINNFLDYIKQFSKGVHARPAKWLPEDNSWEQFKI